METNLAGETKRVAYAMNAERLPTPADGFQWKVAENFNIADELTHDPLKALLYREALARGYALSDE